MLAKRVLPHISSSKVSKEGASHTQSMVTHKTIFIPIEKKK